MTRYRKKLVLTFIDKGGKKRKLHIPDFLEGLDPKDFQQHMKASPVLNCLIDPRREKRQLRKCQNAHIVETFRNDVIKN